MTPGKQANKKRPKPKETVEAGSGNVFADLDLPNPEELLAKAELAGRIAEIIAEQKLTLAEAASVLGVDQPRISALLRGRLDGFSTDRLFRFLNALGQEVEIVVRSPRQKKNRAATRIVVAQ